MLQCNSLTRALSATLYRGRAVGLAQQHGTLVAKNTIKYTYHELKEPLRLEYQPSATSFTQAGCRLFSPHSSSGIVDYRGFGGPSQP